MPLSGFVIAVGSKALFACLSQYIKYQLNSEGLEKQIITSVSDIFLQNGSDSLVKRITSKLFPQKTLQDKYTHICNNVFNNLMKAPKYEKIFQEWFKDFCLNNPTISDDEFFDIEISLQQWFSHHPSLHMDINTKIKEFIIEFNQLTNKEIQKDQELAIYFETIKNGRNENEILLKVEELLSIHNDLYCFSQSQYQLLNTKNDRILAILESNNYENTEIIEKKKYLLTRQ